MVTEQRPGLGDEEINYQEYVVPAFLTQVGADDDADGGWNHNLTGDILPGNIFPGDILPGDGPHQRIIHRRTSTGN